MGTDKNKISNDIKKRIIKFCIPFVMLMMILIIGTVAWFTFGKEVTAGNLTLRSSDLPFEIASYGTDGYYDKYIADNPADGEEPAEVHEVYEYDSSQNKWIMSNDKLLTKNEEKSFLEKITGQKSSIQWQISETSNFANYKSDSDVQQDEKDINDEEDKLEYRLEPGDFGCLEFFIIPKISGDLNLKFTLDIDLYEKSDTEELVLDPSYALKLSEKYKSEETAEGKDLQQLILMHHILFFREYDAESGYRGLLGYDKNTNAFNPGNDYKMTYTAAINDAVKDKAYLFRVYWIWPNILGQTVLSDKNEDILIKKNNQPVFGDSNEKQAYISKMKSNPDWFFNGIDENSDEGNVNADKHDSTESVIDKISAEDYVVSDINDDYYKLSYYWNKADQYIGYHISYITAEMSVIESN